jgi:hypothetical protein
LSGLLALGCAASPPGGDAERDEGEEGVAARVAVAARAEGELARRERVRAPITRADAAFDKDEGRSCVGRCGGAAALCFCDDQCELFGDCCADKVDLCGEAPPPPPAPHGSNGKHGAPLFRHAGGGVRVARRQLASAGARAMPPSDRLRDDARRAVAAAEARPGGRLAPRREAAQSETAGFCRATEGRAATRRPREVPEPRPPGRVESSFWVG